jgi:hypothetical protein
MINQKKTNWRAEIDTFIEEEMLACGFQKLDDYSFSVPVSEGVVGLFHIENQTLMKGPVSSLARIRPRVGVCHIVLEEIGMDLSPMVRQPQPKVLNWTVDRAFKSKEPVVLHSWDIFKQQTSAEKRKKIEDLAQQMKISGVPYVIDNFADIKDIEYKLLTHPVAIKYPILLVLQGRAEEALAYAQTINNDLAEAKVNPIIWTPFYQQFLQWMNDGAPVPAIANRS